MKKLCVITQNKRLLKNWKRILSPQFQVLNGSSFDQARHQIDPEDYLILHDQGTTDRLLGEIDAINSYLSGHHMLILRDEPKLEEGEMLLVKGIGGYGNANMNDPIFSQAVSVMTNGSIWLYPQLLNRVIEKFNQRNRTEQPDFMNRLTKREQEVAVLVADGESNQMIAQDLRISPNTVKLHLASIFGKLQIKSRVALALLVGKRA